jgi:hypothetical protein
MYTKVVAKLKNGIEVMCIEPSSEEELLAIISDCMNDELIAASGSVITISIKKEIGD